MSKTDALGRRRAPSQDAALAAHRPRGRPKLPPAERKVRVDIRLTQATLEHLDATTDNRSAFIEAAVREKLERGVLD